MSRTDMSCVDVSPAEQLKARDETDMSGPGPDRSASGGYSSRGTKSDRVSGIRDHGATSTTATTEPEPVDARTWRSPSLRRACSSSPAGLTSSSCWPTDAESSTASSRNSTTGAGSSSSSAERRPQARPVGRRLAQRHRAAPGAAADELRRERDLAERPARPLRPCEQPVEQRAEGAPERQFVPDRLGELERLGELRRRAPTADATAVAAAREPPRLPAFPTETLRDSSPGQGGQLPQAAHAQTLQLRVAIGRERQERERQRCQKALLLAGRHDECLPGTRDARRRKGGEPALRRARAWIPGSSDGGERPLQRRLQASVQPLDALRLEVDATRLLGVDGEARVLEPLQHPLPLALDRSRILLDEDELRAHRERLPQPHPRLHAGELGGGGDGTDELLGSGQRRERRRHERQPRLVPQRRAQLEAGDDETGDHGNVCSTPEQVFLSTA